MSKKGYTFTEIDPVNNQHKEGDALAYKSNNQKHQQLTVIFETVDFTLKKMNLHNNYM